MDGVAKCLLSLESVVGYNYIMPDFVYNGQESTRPP